MITPLSFGTTANPFPFPGLLNDDMEQSISIFAHDYAALFGTTANPFPFPGLLNHEMDQSISISAHDYAALLKRLRETESRAETAETKLAAAAEDLAKMRIFAEDFVINQTEEKKDVKVEWGKMGLPLYFTRILVIIKFCFHQMLDTSHHDRQDFLQILQKKWVTYFTLGDPFYPTLP